METPRGFRLQATKPLALDGSLVGREVIARLGLGGFGERIASETQQRTRHVYDYRVALERDESMRSMRLPLELYGTDEQAALGKWELLEANIAPLQDTPFADLTQRAMSRSGRLLSPNVRRTDVVP